jgi:hypothetical protein
MAGNEAVMFEWDWEMDETLFDDLVAYPLDLENEILYSSPSLPIISKDLEDPADFHERNDHLMACLLGMVEISDQSLAAERFRMQAEDPLVWKRKELKRRRREEARDRKRREVIVLDE